MKKLVRVGSSVGLVIDKPILDRLALRKGSIVEYQIQDGRLVVQPSRNQPPQLEARVVVPQAKPVVPMLYVMRALDGHAFGNREAARLTGDNQLLAIPTKYLSFYDKAVKGEFGELVELRLRALLERRNAQPMFRPELWDATIDAVLDAIPDLPAVTDERPVGIEHLL